MSVAYASTRDTFRTSRLLDFASERELTAQIGHPSAQWPRVIIKELVDNSLDACEEHDIAPVIRVRVEAGLIEVSDNGPGIAAEVVEDILDFSVRVSSREAYVGPTRGAQGNALKTLVAMPFVLDGGRGLVEIEGLGVHHIIDFSIDRIAHEPRAERTTKPSFIKAGTTARVGWPDSASSILTASGAAIRRDLNKFACFNPHLTIEATILDQEPLRFEATDRAWRRWRPRDPMPPQWFDLERFERLIAATIHHDRTGGRYRTVREFVAQFRGLTAMAKQKAILVKLDLARVGIDTLVRDGDIDHQAAARLLAAMQAESKPPKAAQLGLIGRDHLLARLPLGEVGRQSFTYRKRLDDNPRNPRVAEMAFAFDEDTLERRLLLCGLNNSPALSDAGAFRELGVDGLGGLLGRQYARENAPIVFALHLTGARLSFTDRGKSAVAL